MKKIVKLEELLKAGFTLFKTVPPMLQKIEGDMMAIYLPLQEDLDSETYELSYYGKAEYGNKIMQRRIGK